MKKSKAVVKQKSQTPAVARSYDSPPLPSTMAPDEVALILERAPMFQAWLDAVKVHALELMQKGIAVPGYKAVPKMTRFAWNRELTPAIIAKKLGLKREQVVEERTLSPSKVKKLMTAAKGKSRVDELTWRPFEVTVAKESDRRMALPSTKISFQPVSREENDDGE